MFANTNSLQIYERVIMKNTEARKQVSACPSAPLQKADIDLRAPKVDTLIAIKSGDLPATSTRPSPRPMYSPVPGGVGPLTIAMLMKNTVQAARLRRTP